MRILITGSNGFSARHLIAHLSKNTLADLFLTDIHDTGGKNYYSANLADYQSVMYLLQAIKPQQIYHLAGSFSQDYALDYAVNVLSTRHILEVIATTQLDCKVLLIGSAAEYGQVNPEDNPVKETQALRPLNPYGLTKVFQTQLMDFYVRTRQLEVVMARTFNLFGEGISPRLMIGNLYRQLADFQAHKLEKIKLGNLATQRDYISIEVAVADYYCLMNVGRSGEVYNVGSGEAILLEDLVQKILATHGIDMQVVDYQMISPQTADVGTIWADIAKIRALKNIFLV